MTRDTLIVDTHSHFYSCYEIGRYLQSADANMHLTTNTLGCLCLATNSNDHPFAQIRKASLRLGQPWELCDTDESVSLLVRRREAPRLVLIASRQIVTQEGLEVLALGTDRLLASGQELLRTIDQIHEANALAVVPWGVGKWCLDRGRKLVKALRRAADERVALFLGDVAARTQWLGVSLSPELRRSFHWLCGSDPLPIRNGEQSVGRLASRLPCRIDLCQPSANIVQALQALSASPQRVGSYDSVACMLSNQIKLRLLREAG